MKQKVIGSEMLKVILVLVVASYTFLCYAKGDETIDLGSQSVLAESREMIGEYDAAVQIYEQILSSITQDPNKEDSELSAPLLGLGRSLIELDQPWEAEPLLRKGQAINHRFEGVLSLKQIPFVEQLTRLYLESDRPLEANNQQEFILYLHERNYGKSSLQISPVLNKLAIWYLETGQFTRSKNNLERSIGIIESEGGLLDLRLNEPLTLLAKIQRLKKGTSCCGEHILQRVVDIVETNPLATTEDKVQAYLELADAYIISGKPRRADRYYRKAWSLQAALNVMDSPRQLSMRSQLDRSNITRLRPPASSYPFRVPVARRHLLTEAEMRQRGYTETTLDVPPQQVIVSLDENTPYVRISDSGPAQYEGEKSIQVIGYPFQFVLKQLQHILPPRFGDPHKLSTLQIDLLFTVSKSGSVNDIVLSNSNAPVKLNRVIKHALQKSRFRPRIQEGNRVDTSQVKLTQTFVRS